ncbi:polyphenol oxidase family protein [Campylobacter geochelonis]|uniref:polyphenol oxidase family protein n=1 Tax=Campylobacter geochelonis TaxID=1780362 RepID=UPI000770A823|nr:polyphenol oxidase family protein [Campylobacter geochelonis]CZE50561.1 laccase [Campylobacter geochelonis]
MGNGRENFKPLLDDGRVVLGFSTRFGGISKGVFGSLNLAFHVGDNPLDVLKNREILALNLGLDDLIFLNQVHGSEICVVDETFRAEFRAKFNQILTKFNLGSSGFDSINLAKFSDELLAIYPTSDAVITDLRGVGICVMVADCSPILLYDKVRKVVGAVHAGRAGVMQKILSKTARKMGEIYGLNLKDLEVFIGANIKGSCYEVAGLSLGEFEGYKKDDKFDMNLALLDELKELGVTKYHFSDVCTHCDKRYFSYRRDGVTGRFVGYVALRK